MRTVENGKRIAFIDRITDATLTAEELNSRVDKTLQEKPHFVAIYLDVRAKSDLKRDPKLISDYIGRWGLEKFEALPLRRTPPPPSHDKLTPAEYRALSPAAKTELIRTHGEAYIREILRRPEAEAVAK